MSLSVNSSNANPFATLQSLWQQATSQNTAASDPLSQLLGAIDQQAGSGSSSTSTAAAAGSSATGSALSGGSLQFGPQTLQALFALQANWSNSQSLASQVDGGSNSAASSTDPTQQAQAGQQAHHGHHHHHGMGGGGQNLLDALFSPSGATSQTATNSNGSSTTTITYADGSSVALTSAPTSSTSASSSSASSDSSTAGTANVAGNNLIEQLIQMQAQLLNTTTPQSIATV